MGETFIAWVDQYGVSIVFVTVLVGQMGIPIPAIGILIAAGAIVAESDLSAPAVFGAAVGACLIADGTLFALGRRYGNDLLTRIGRLARLPGTVQVMEDRFRHWGGSSLVIAKFIPGWTTLAPPMAGAVGTSWLRFLLFSCIGAILWTAVGMALGAGFAAEIPQLFEHMRLIGLVAFAAVSGLFLLCAAIGWRRRRNTARPLVDGQ
jgi:membrane protein DedA with SNARE-associated domain